MKKKNIPKEEKEVKEVVKVKKVIVVDDTGKVVREYSQKENGPDYKEIAQSEARRVGGSVEEK